MRLQVAVAAYVDSPGKMPFNKFRAFRTMVREAEEPFRFVDGELIEHFLVCEPAVQDEIVGLVGGGAEVDGIKAMIEALRRLH
jgi:DNA damage-binding protein 1